MRFQVNEMLIKKLNKKKKVSSLGSFSFFYYLFNNHNV